MIDPVATLAEPAFVAFVHNAAGSTNLDGAS